MCTRTPLSRANSLSCLIEKQRDAEQKNVLSVDEVTDGSTEQLHLVLGKQGGLLIHEELGAYMTPTSSAARESFLFWGADDQLSVKTTGRVGMLAVLAETLDLIDSVINDLPQADSSVGVTIVVTAVGGAIQSL
jgi:hypothetical protein